MMGHRMHKAKLIADRAWRECNYGFKYYSELLNKQKAIGLRKKTRCFCSSPFCCGNPRKTKKGKERFTVQERRHLVGYNLDRFEC